MVNKMAQIVFDIKMMYQPQSEILALTRVYFLILMYLPSNMALPDTGNRSRIASTKASSSGESFNVCKAGSPGIRKYRSLLNSVYICSLSVVLIRSCA